MPPARRSGSAGWSRTAPGCKAGETNDFIVTDGADRDDGALCRHPARPVPRRAGRGGRGQRWPPTAAFAATNVLAKHDENYMPKEVVEALKASGEWQRERAGVTAPVTASSCGPISLASMRSVG